MILWGWDENLYNVPFPFNKNSILIKNDLALLQLEASGDELAALNDWSESLHFLKGDLNGAQFEAYSRKTDDPWTTVHIAGKIAGKDPSAGATILNPDLNENNFFFDTGSSGSPVFAEISVHPDYAPIAGIVGYVDFLNKLPNSPSKDARMLNTQRIEEVIVSNSGPITFKIKDVDTMRKIVSSEVASRKIFNQRGKELFCDRLPVIESIQNRIASHTNLVSAFLIYGNEKQLLDCFIDRYRLEFIANSGKESNVIYFKMPSEADKGIFCSKLIGSILIASKTPFKRFSENDATLITIKHIMDELFFDDGTYFVFDCRVENNSINRKLEGCYKWFFKDFLAPLYNNRTLSKKLHFFVSFYYRPGDEYKDNKEFLFKFFKEFSLPELVDIKKSEVLDWLDLVEGQDILRRNQIMEYFQLQELYTMADVIFFYKQALHKIESF